MRMGWDRSLWTGKVVPMLAAMAVFLGIVAYLFDGIESKPMPGDRWVWPEKPDVPPGPPEPPDPTWFGLTFALALPLAFGAAVMVWRRWEDLAAALSEAPPNPGVRPAPAPPFVVVAANEPRFAELVAFGRTFEPPDLSPRFDPFHLRATASDAGRFQALEFSPGAVIVELAAVVHRDGSGFLPGVIEFLGALRLAGIPRAFVHQGAAPALIVALARYGAVHRLKGTLGETLRAVADGLAVPPDRCAVIVGSAGSVSVAHAVDCLTIAVLAPDVTRVSGADLVVSRLRADWIHADGVFRLT